MNFCDKNCEYDFKDTSADDGYARTAPVGSYPAGTSPYGALDMVGNVSEWVADWYVEDYYARSPARNPQGPGSGVSRGLRGGLWFNTRTGVRSGGRDEDYPDSGSGDTGFRCASDTPSP